MEFIEGVVEKIIYKSDDGTFIVAKISQPNSDQFTAIVGNMGSVNVGDSIKAYGKWEKYKNSNNFNQIDELQFRVENYEIIEPSTTLGIKKYLSSGIIKGLGEKYAEKIVEKFGIDTFYVIENEPEKLKSIPGIGNAKIKNIKKGWESNKQIKNVMVFLQGQGISATYSSKIYKKYKENTISLVRENPYRLADDISGIGFKKADQIARSFGIDKNSPFRIDAYIIYKLQQYSQDGNVYYPYIALIEDCKEELELSNVEIEKSLNRLSSKNNEKIIIDKITFDSTEISNFAVYLKNLYYSETKSASKLIKLLNEKTNSLKIDFNEAIRDYQTVSLIMLSETQKEAVKNALENKVMVITGGPGTGKTTIIKCICDICNKLELKIKLAAPTGRASKRMEEATSIPAKTIHRLLEFSSNDSNNYYSFKKNEDNPIEADIIIIDEFSMVDISIFCDLLNAISLNTRLIMVGDVDQLPSIGPGQVLRDIIESKQIPFIKLNQIYRQKKNSFITINAHKVNNGEKIINLDEQNDNDNLRDFYFINQEDTDKIVKIIIHLCKNRIPKRFNYDPLNDIQILTPMLKGKLGVKNLNNVLQSELNFVNSNNKKIQKGQRTFTIGDKVMQTKNNYDKEVYNGDIGKIEDISEEDGTVTIKYDDKLIEYGKEELDQINLAYAISIHKSQGSEYKAVIIPIHTEHYIMLKRNLLYTAITRGKGLVILIGTKKALNIAIRNSEVESRYTMLKNRIILLNNDKQGKYKDSDTLF